jgi:hypothetical protein
MKEFIPNKLPLKKRYTDKRVDLHKEIFLVTLINIS